MNGYALLTRFPVHWGELDLYGHVNNTRFFVWFETARMAWFQAVGLLEGAGRPEGMGPILASTQADFLRPVRFPADLVVGARCSRMGNTSFVLEYAVALADAADEPVARGSSVVVLIDYSTGATVRVPDALRASITALDGTR